MGQVNIQNSSGKRVPNFKNYFFALLICIDGHGQFAVINIYTVKSKTKKDSRAYGQGVGGGGKQKTYPIDSLHYLKEIAIAKV